MTTTAMIYARVSTKEQGNNHSLPTQLEMCRQHCERRNSRVLNEFTDTHSGTVSDRPGMNALLDAVAISKPDLVVILDVDRLARETKAQAFLESELLAYGGRIEFVNGGVITSDGDQDEMITDFKKMIAKQENRIRVERSRRGKRGRVQEGFPILPAGHSPFGYTYIREPKKGRLEVNEEEAAVVREMYHWLLVERVSSYEIAKRLHSRGVPTRGDLDPAQAKKTGHGEWSPSTIRRIFSSPLYKGEFIWGKVRHISRDGKRRQIPVPESEWVKIAIPAIVDETMWNTAQVRLSENKTNASRNTQREYLLRGMIFCTCGRRRVGRYKNHLDKAYYRCPTTEAESWRNGCTARFSYRQERVEAAVWGKVVEFLLDPATIAVEVERQRKAQATQSEKRARRLATVRKELADIEKKLAALLDMELDGYPKSVIEQRKGTLIERHHEFTAERERLEAERQEVEITPEVEGMLLHVSRLVQIALPAMTFADKRRVLELLRIRVDVLDRDIVRLSGIITGAVVNMQCSWRR